MILNKEQRAIALAQLIEEIKVKHNITIEIPTVSGIMPRACNDSEKFCSLRYDSDRGFEISTSGSWVTPNEAVQYATKLLNLSAVAVKLNQLYKPL